MINETQYEIQIGSEKVGHFPSGLLLLFLSKHFKKTSQHGQEIAMVKAD